MVAIADVLEGRARWAVVEGDCITTLAQLPPESIDALVTDPPAGIGFMGKAWDADKGGRERWQCWLGAVMLMAFRAMKPGAHGLVWALPRTSHWTATALEDAGFEVRDRVSHLFGTGFPKSADVGKALDKRAGAKRRVVRARSYAATDGGGYSGGLNTSKPRKESAEITAPATDAAKLWDGWGTALKPAVEDWWLVRKPLVGTVAANVTKWGTGAINVDGCRIGTSKATPASPAKARDNLAKGQEAARSEDTSAFNPNIGRWPAHLVLDEEAAAMLDAQSGTLKSGGLVGAKSIGQTMGDDVVYGGGFKRTSNARHSGSSGGASRFFYTAKVSRAERDRGCEHLPPKSGGEATDREEGSAGLDSPRAGAGRGGGVRNTHPTVKPQALMRWLVRLITPPGGVVLDPFAGSGSTGMAALAEGCRFIGVEQEAAYAEIARARIGAADVEPAQQELLSVEPQEESA